MPEASQDFGALLMAVGELKGKVGELVHVSNNNGQKIDGMAERLFTSPTHADLAKIENKIDGVALRLDLLERDRDLNEGAKGIIAKVMGSKAFGVIATAILSAFTALAALKGGIVK